jgi:ABC-2 type transport system permease protein
MRTIENIFWLDTKELRSFMRDFVLLGLVVYAFSLAIIAQAQSSAQEVHNASIAIVDEDHSVLSRRIARAFLPPYPNAATDRGTRYRSADERGKVYIRNRHPAEF